MIIKKINTAHAMKKIIITGIFGMVMGASAAQQLPLLSQYYSNPFIYNPSLTGVNAGDDVRAFLMHKSQWKDIPGAPMTSLLTVDGPIREKNVGLGITLFNDVTDITERMGAYTSYSYKIKIDDDNKIYAGLAVGVLSSKIDFSKAIVKDKDDPMLFQNVERKATFDANLGVTYMWKVLEVGVSVPQLIGHKIKYVNNESSAFYQLNRHFLASAKYTFDVVKDKGMTAYPLVMVRAAKGAPVQYDINAVFDWANMGWAGVSYRSNYAVGMNVGVRLNNTLSAGYAYDLTIGPLSSYSGGAHEIMLSYTFGKKSESTEPVITPVTTDNRTNEALTDSMLAVLKNNDKLQKARIEKLEEEVEKLRIDKITAGLDTAKGDMRSAKSSDFKDELGNKLEPGYYYVIIGAFKERENAGNAKNTWLQQGYLESQMVMNDKNGFTYVYVLKTKEEAKATEILNTVRQTVKDSWVFVAQ
jgi:type IX secretion system PorP/SprF family membrane protein